MLQVSFQPQADFLSGITSVEMLGAVFV